MVHALARARWSFRRTSLLFWRTKCAVRISADYGWGRRMLFRLCDIISVRRTERISILWWPATGSRRSPTMIAKLHFYARDRSQCCNRRCGTTIAAAVFCVRNGGLDRQLKAESSRGDNGRNPAGSRRPVAAERQSDALLSSARPPANSASDATLSSPNGSVDAAGRLTTSTLRIRRNRRSSRGSGRSCSRKRAPARHRSSPVRRR